MFINKENLNFEEIYSSLQKRWIPVVQKEETCTFEDQVYMTVQKEVLPYIKQETLKQKENIKDVQRLMIKKLKKKETK